MISLTNLSYYLGSRALYENASMHIKPGQKIGLIGLNGTGKSTLLRLIIGEYQLDGGIISKAGDVTIGFLNQDLLSYQTDDSILSVAMQAFERQNHLQKRIDTLLHEMEVNYTDALIDKLARAQDEGRRRLLRRWLGLALDRAGRHAQAAETWAALEAEVAPERLPLLDPPPPSTAPLPPLAEVAEPAPATVFLYGPPGSRVEQLALVMHGAVAAFRADRFGPNPPTDLLQNYNTPRQLASGERSAAEVADSWRAQRPARGLDERETIDWLLWWDNSLLQVLRECLPHASLLLAVRDPRDMLLDWLAFGAPAPLRIQSPKTAAGWLSIELNQLAQLHENDLFPHQLVKLDEIATDGPALVAAASDALRVALPEVPAAALGPARFPPGHWRLYADALAEPFAMLGPVARRLGYPER